MTWQRARMTSVGTCGRRIASDVSAEDRPDGGPTVAQLRMRHLQLGAPSAIIVEGLISTAQKLGMRVVAEGIETEAQVAKLRAFGCALGQGYLLARAVHRDEATAMLLIAAQRPSDMLRPVGATAPPKSPTNSFGSRESGMISSSNRLQSARAIRL